MRALIIGGGIGGLTTAIALYRRGISAQVFEQAPALQEVGAGIVLWPNAINRLRSFGLVDAIVAAGARMERGELRRADGGVAVSSDQQWLEQECGAPAIALHRADLQSILRAALPADAVTLGARLRTVTQDAASVTAHFEDGTTATGDVLIGADGIRSVVRAAIRPEIQLRYSGYVAWRGVVDGARAMGPGTSETWGRGERFGIVPIGGDRVYWFATGNRAAGIHSNAEARRDELLRRFGAWHAPIRSLIERTPLPQILENGIHDSRPFRGWSRGRVTLLGDAAHPTTPNMGQGACMAIESGVAIARA
ncbi:MAG: FAD-dependent monooxygenase, partial [Acidobacteria bacterium]|nr:FAD-dependent monooxygenase [Acidobacteriota bacterium]